MRHSFTRGREVWGVILLDNAGECPYSHRCRRFRRFRNFLQRREDPSLAAIFVSSDALAECAEARRGGCMTFRNGRDGDGVVPPGGGAPRHRPLEVTVGDRGVEGAIRLFKRLVLRDGILRDLKRRSRYEKPGDRRRRKAREAARRLRKRQGRALARGEQIE